MVAAGEDATLAAWDDRLRELSEKGRTLEEQGLPFPTDQICTSFDAAVQAGQPMQAAGIVKRGEALLAKVGADWSWVRELLRRVDELRAVAQKIGVDVLHLDSRVGNPRKRLMNEPLSAGSLEKAAASASLALAVLNDAIPKFCLQEAEQLGASIRRARDRGEEVLEATQAFSQLLQAVQDQNIPTAAQRLIEVRRAVVHIPRAPAIPSLTPSEEEEILLEARNLARRLQQIKGKARNAQSAARLMAQVRAAISEERRYGTPEEEIEALWAEVDRLTREKKRASEGPPIVPVLPSEEAVPPEVDAGIPSESEIIESAVDPPPPEGTAAGARAPGTSPSSTRDPAEESPEELDEPPTDDEEEESDRSKFRSSLYVPYVPPDFGEPPPSSPEGSENGRGRGRSRTRP